MAKADNYRRINYVYSLRGPRAASGRNCIWHLAGEKREETAKEAAEVEEAAASQLDDCGVRHAKPNFISHFEKD